MSTIVLFVSVLNFLRDFKRNIWDQADNSTENYIKGSVHTNDNNYNNKDN